MLESLGSARTVQYAQLLVDLFTTTGQEEFLFSAKAGGKFMTRGLHAMASIYETRTMQYGHVGSCSNSERNKLNKAGRETSRVTTAQEYALNSQQTLMSCPASCIHVSCILVCQSLKPAGMQVCIHMCMCMCIHIYIYTHTYLHTYICSARVHVHVRIHTHDKHKQIYVCIYIYIHIYYVSISFVCMCTHRCSMF